MFDLSFEKAKLIQQKTEEIKEILDQEYIKQSSLDNTIQVTVSVSGNIKEIKISENVKIDFVIPVLNEVLSTARQTFEIKRAEMLQDELKKLI